MRYFFDIDGDEPDDDGIDFLDMTMALKAALDSLPGMAADPEIGVPETIHVTVRDERGPVCRASLEIYRRRW